MLQINNHKRLQSIAVMALCAIFFLLAMAITLVSSNIYRNIIADSNDNYIHRTALSYLINQVRRNDSNQSIAVSTLQGCDAIVLTQTEGDTEYITYLYCYDGQLRELYIESGLNMEAQDGLPIIPLNALTVALDANILHLIMTGENGVAYSASIAPRCGSKEDL